VALIGYDRTRAPFAGFLRVARAFRFRARARLKVGDQDPGTGRSRARCVFSQRILMCASWNFRPAHLLGADLFFFFYHDVTLRVSSSFSSYFLLFFCIFIYNRDTLQSYGAT
jgi:hypothetical protein